jgi:hypothetical protein
MISPISFIFGVPVGRFITFLIRKSANITVNTPAAGTIQKIPGNSDIFPFLELSFFKLELFNVIFPGSYVSNLTRLILNIKKIEQDIISPAL